MVPPTLEEKGLRLVIKNYFLKFMKLFICFLSLLSFSVSEGFAKEIDLNNKLKNTELNTKKVDSREGIQEIDFKKLFSDAETYFNSAKAWKKLKCSPKSGFVCTKHECKKRDIKSFLVLDKENKIIKRCEKENNCERFKAQFAQTGVYFNVQTSGPVGTLIRILGDSRFKEISTVGLDAYIVNGNCEVILQDQYSEEDDDKIEE
jgi:hypothetical protein